MSELDYTTRTCKKCGTERHITDYKKTGKWIRHECTPCLRARKNSYPPREKNAEYQRAYRLKTVFGMTIKEYDELLEAQNFCCAICEKSAASFKTRLAVDHNHKTGEVRGLLCSFCNHRLIGRHRDGELLRKMADYVDGGTGKFVPEEYRKPRRRKRPVKRRPNKARIH